MEGKLNIVNSLIKAPVQIALCNKDVGKFFVRKKKQKKTLNILLVWILHKTFFLKWLPPLAFAPTVQCQRAGKIYQYTVMCRHDPLLQDGRLVLMTSEGSPFLRRDPFLWRDPMLLPPYLWRYQAVSQSRIPTKIPLLRWTKRKLAQCGNYQYHKPHFTVNGADSELQIT